MSWQSNAHALISLLAALAPALVGLHAWRRRGKPGAISLAALAWLFAPWALVYAAELGRKRAGGGLPPRNLGSRHAWRGARRARVRAPIHGAQVVLLVLMLVNSQKLYARQSLDILTR